MSIWALAYRSERGGSQQAWVHEDGASRDGHLVTVVGLQLELVGSLVWYISVPVHVLSSNLSENAEIRAQAGGWEFGYGTGTGW